MALSELKALIVAVGGAAPSGGAVFLRWLFAERITLPGFLVEGTLRQSRRMSPTLCVLRRWWREGPGRAGLPTRYGRGSPRLGWRRPNHRWQLPRLGTTQLTTKGA